jgi:hypothetical protein
MMESAKKHQMFCYQVIPFANRDAFLFRHNGFRLCRKPYDDITMLNAGTESCGPKPFGFPAGLRKFVPDRQNLYHKRIGLET